jgi:hypothetical protein
MPDSFPDFRVAELPDWATDRARSAYKEACEVALLRFRERTKRDPDMSKREDAEQIWICIIEDLESQADQILDIGDDDFEKEAAEIRRLAWHFNDLLDEVRNVVVPFRKTPPAE